MPLRKSVKGRFAAETPSSRSWISRMTSCPRLWTNLSVHLKPVLRISMILVFYLLSVPLMTAVILMGHVWEESRRRWLKWPKDRKGDQDDDRVVDDTSSLLDKNMISLMVSAVNRREVIDFLEDKIGSCFTSNSSHELDFVGKTCDSRREPVIFQEMIPKFLSAFASSHKVTQQEAHDNHCKHKCDIEVVKVTRPSPVLHVTSSYLVTIRSSDQEFLDQVLRVFDPTLVVRHEDRVVRPTIEKSSEIMDQMEKLLDLIDGCLTLLPWSENMADYLSFCDKKRVKSAVISVMENSLRLAHCVPLTLNFLISHLVRRIACCHNLQFLLFKPISRSKVCPESLSLAYSDSLPTDLMRRISETSGLSSESVAVSCIASALRAYSQEVSGSIPRDTLVFLQSSRHLDPMEGSSIVLPLESAQDLVTTSARVTQRLTLSAQEREHRVHNKELIQRTLPHFMFESIERMASSGHEIVIKSCYVEGDEQTFIRNIHFWPTAMSPDTLLSFVLMYRKDGVSIGICCKKDAIQSASLLAEFVTKSVTNLCIAFGVQWDRRSPPSTPSDTSSQTVVTL